MGMTVSCSSGRVALRHDARDHMPDNADPEKTVDNVYIMTCDNLETTFNEIFQQSVDEYNMRQKRSDRVIKNYYNHIRDGRGKEKVCYEYVFQIGNKEDNPVSGENAARSRVILQEFAESFPERNPAFHMVSAAIHMDEATPHLHIAFIPVAHGYKSGMRERDSLTKALDNMGYRKEGQTLAVTSWRRAQESFLERLMLNYGIEREKGNGRKERVETHEFKEIMKKADDILSNAKEISKKIVENAERQAKVIRRSAESKNMRLEEKNKELQNELARKSRELEHATVCLQDAHIDRLRIEGEVSSIEEKKNALQDDMDAMKQEYDVLEGQVEILKLLIDNKQTKISELDAEIGGLKNSYEDLRKKPPKEKVIEVEKVTEIHKDYKEMAESALNAFFVQNEFIQKKDLSAESVQYGSFYEIPEMAKDFLQTNKIVSPGQSSVQHRRSSR